MKEIAYIFSTKNNGISTHLKYPTKSNVIAYAKTLDSWDNLFISMKDGFILTLRDYLLNLLEQ